MPLVNTPQIPQNKGMHAPSHTAVPQDMFKMAGSKTALAELGLYVPTDMEKEAILGKALMGGAKAIGKGLWGAGKVVGKGLWGGAKAVGRGLGAVNNVAAKPLGNLGNRAVQRGGKALGASPQAISKVQGLGKGMAREAVGFGALGGTIDAAMADPGQRGKAFLRGAAGGALGGLAWRGGANLASAGLKKGLGAVGANVGKLEGAAAKPWLMGEGLSAGQRLKGVGASALMGGVPLAAGFGASELTPTFHGGGQRPAQQPQRRPFPIPSGRGMRGMYPQGMGGYNPNLPFPRRGY